jgi:hypothetical protein
VTLFATSDRVPISCQGSGSIFSLRQKKLVIHCPVSVYAFD